MAVVGREGETSMQDQSVLLSRIQPHLISPASSYSRNLLSPEDQVEHYVDRNNNCRVLWTSAVSAQVSPRIQCDGNAESGDLTRIL